MDTHGLDPESLLLDPAFLEDVLSKYSVQPQAGAPPHPAHFVLKHLNIVDPLLPSNNLGRSVSKASFARIRRAFAHGANAISNIMKKVRPLLLLLCLVLCCAAVPLVCLSLGRRCTSCCVGELQFKRYGLQQAAGMSRV